jgi:hypothetical protein
MECFGRQRNFCGLAISTKLSFCAMTIGGVQR